VMVGGVGPALLIRQRGVMKTGDLAMT
jgi:hypothetical protein